MSELFTFEECALKGRVSVKTLKRDAAAGKLVTTRIRGRVRIGDIRLAVPRLFGSGAAYRGAAAMSPYVNALGHLSRFGVQTPDHFSARH